MADFIGFDLSQGLGSMANQWSQGYKDARDLEKYEKQLAIEESKIKAARSAAAQESAAKYGMHDKETLKGMGGNFVDFKLSELDPKVKSIVEGFKGIMPDKVEISEDNVSLHPYAAEMVKKLIEDESSANASLARAQLLEQGKNQRSQQDIAARKSIAAQKALPLDLKALDAELKAELALRDPVNSQSLKAKYGPNSVEAAKMREANITKIVGRMQSLAGQAPQQQMQQQPPQDEMIIVVNKDGVKAKAKRSQLEALKAKGYTEAGK